MRKPLTLRVMALVIFCVAFATEAFSAEGPFRLEVRGDHRELNALVRKPAVVASAFRAIKFGVRDVHGLGNLSFVFNERKLPAGQAVFVSGLGTIKDLNVPTLMKGYVLALGNQRVPAALSVIRGKVRLQFSSAFGAQQARSPKLYSISWKLSDSVSALAKVAVKPNSSLLGKLCDSSHSKEQNHSGINTGSKGDKHELVSTLSTSSSEFPAKTTTMARVVTLSTDADEEWYKKYGDSSNAEIAAIVNAAEAIFEKQLGLRFALVRQHVYMGQSPYISTDASALLLSFAKNPENPGNLGYSPLTFNDDVDTKYLFTGKDLGGSVIGLSYVGAVCWSPQNAYGLIQNINRELNITTFSHEIAHTLGAHHDPADADSIMYPHLGIKRYFSQVSVDQMNRAIASTGKCVTEEMVSANLANAKLTLKNIKAKSGDVVLAGKLLSNLGSPLINEIVKITVNGKVSFVITNPKGVFKYTVKRKGLKGRKLIVFAQTMNNEVAIPNALKVAV